MWYSPEIVIQFMLQLFRGPSQGENDARLDTCMRALIVRQYSDEMFGQLVNLLDHSTTLPLQVTANDVFVEAVDSSSEVAAKCLTIHVNDHQRWISMLTVAIWNIVHTKGVLIFRHADSLAQVILRQLAYTPVDVTHLRILNAIAVHVSTAMADDLMVVTLGLLRQEVKEMHPECRELYKSLISTLSEGVSGFVLSTLVPDIVELIESPLNLELNACLAELLCSVKMDELQAVHICKRLMRSQVSPGVLKTLVHYHNKDFNKHH
jgi:hypothetical protein